jgi:hypothetical protein
MSDVPFIFLISVFWDVEIWVVQCAKDITTSKNPEISNSVFSHSSHC